MSELPSVPDWLAQVLAVLPERPHRIRLGAGEVTLEVEWGDPVRTPAPVAPAAAAALTAALTAGPGPEPAAPEPVVVPATIEPQVGGHRLCSPTVGTFYRSAEPGGPPFVSEGQSVRPGQQIAIVEAMKLMLPVEADRAGRITDIFTADGDFVEYGTPLMSLAAD